MDRDGITRIFETFGSSTYKGNVKSGTKGYGIYLCRWTAYTGSSCKEAASKFNRDRNIGEYDEGEKTICNSNVGLFLAGKAMGRCWL